MRDKRELRKFGVLMAGALSVFGAVAAFRGRATLSLIFFVIGAAFLAMAAVLPTALRQVYRGWMVFARILAWVNTRILLGVIFYAALTPMSIIMRTFGRDALRRRLDRSSSSYWHPREAMKPAKERYERLF